MFKNLSLQERFYIGYIYLIILGVVSDALFYAILRVPYLNYISILDALISPLNLITNDWLTPIALISLFTFMYFYTVKWLPKLHKKYRDKKWYKTFTNIEKWDRKIEKQKDKTTLISNLMILFFFMFISFSLGRAIGKRARLNNKKFSANWRLIFKDNSTLDIYKIGQNSSYIFYTEEGESEITVTPILENIKQIKRIPKDK